MFSLPILEGRRPRTAGVVLAAFALTFVTSTAFAQAPPANAVIGNQASATYQDAGVTRTVFSNTVETVVQQVGGVALVANRSQPATAGGTVTFPHTVRNTGNGDDTFGIVVSQGAGAFNFTSIQIFADSDGDGVADGPVITDTGVLAPSATGGFNFVILAGVPAGASGGDASQLTVTVTSVFDTNQTDANDDTATVSEGAVLAMTKDVTPKSGAAGATLTYTLTYVNNGNGTAASVTTTDALPAGVTYVPGSARWSVLGATALTDATGDVQSPSAGASDTIDYSITSGVITAVISQVAAGQSGTLTFQVTVDGGVAAGPITNIARFAYDDGAGTVVPPTDTNPADFEVLEAANVDVEANTTIANAAQGSTIEFAHTVTNNGNAADTFNLTIENNGFPPGTNVTFLSPGGTPLTDTNGDGIPDTGSLAPGDVGSIVVQVVLPAIAIGGPFTLEVVGTSLVDPTVSDSVTDTLTEIDASAVDVTHTAAAAGPGTPVALANNNSAAGDPAFTVLTDPGATVTLESFFVANTGQSTDSFNLRAFTDEVNLTLLPGWTVTFADTAAAGGAVRTNTGVLAPGGSLELVVTVSVPGGETPQDVNIFLEAFSPTTGANNRLVDLITVNAVRQITIEPNQQGQVAPGGTVFYTHIVFNSGNATEAAIGIRITDSVAGFTSSIFVDSGTIAGQLDAGDVALAFGGASPSTTAALPDILAGQSLTLLVKVVAPPGNVGADNVSLIELFDGAVVLDDANDTTTVIVANVVLVKEQALEDPASPGNPLTFGVAQLRADPGEVIFYRITATNLGTLDATNVVMNDQAPPFTTYATVPTVTTPAGAGSLSGTPPSVGGVGGFATTAITLAPSESLVVEFSVTVNN